MKGGFIMEHTFEELKKKRVVELKEIASGLDHDAVKGYTQMHKEPLVTAICKALGIETFTHHVAKDAHKSEVKAKIKMLKVKRLEILASSDKSELKGVIKQINHLKHRLRKAAL